VSDAGVHRTASNGSNATSAVAPEQLRIALAERYEVGREVGRGGMATVYAAHDLRHDRPVALKVLNAAACRALDARPFMGEIRAVARLTHPHVLPLYDSGEAAGFLYYVMPLVVGGTLRDRLRTEGALAIAEAVRIAGEIAAALDYAHRAGTVHRDVKPENILLSSGHALLADFGVAQALAAPGDAHLTGTRVIAGSPRYMSPEQTSGEGIVDGRSDVYALACVLYEMLTGEPPFRRPTRRALILAHLLDPPPALRGVRPDASETLERAVQRAMAKEAEARYATADDFAVAIRAGAVAESAGPGSHARRDGSPAIAVGRATLPASATPFVGREAEVRELHALLGDTRIRLLTLVGPGGAGKTRLALEVARGATGRGRGEVIFVPLASVRDPALLPSAIASVLGVSETAGQPMIEALKTRLSDGDHARLLLLDNLEQLLAAAPVIGDLLAAAPRLKILATSQAPLGLAGEQEYPVRPLAVPAAGDAAALSIADLARSEAVSLFVQRARAVNPTFALTEDNRDAVVEICRRLDGLPLAIELAAARTRLLAPRALLPRLSARLKLLTGGARDVPTRHQTLRAAVTWSYELLDRSERQAFERLGVFAGGAPLDAALAVCGSDPNPDATPRDDTVDDVLLDVLGGLVGRSLVQRDEEADGTIRLRLLETLREFALERLGTSGAVGAISAAHRDWYLAFAEEAARHLTGAAQPGWLARLRREYANLIAALDWSMQDTAGDGGKSALRFALALWRFWLVQGELREGRARLEAVLRLPAAADRGVLRAQLLIAIAKLAQNLGDYGAAYERIEESLAIQRERGDRRGTASALTSLGWIAWRRGRYEYANRLSEEGLALYRALGDERGVTEALTNLGWIAHHQGQRRQSRAYHEEALALRRRTGNPLTVAFALTNVAWSMVRTGDVEPAVRLLDEANALFGKIGERQLRAFAAAVRASAYYERSEDARALELIERESLPIFRAIGDEFGVALAIAQLAQVALARGDGARAEVLATEVYEICTRVGETYGIGGSLYLLGAAAAAQGQLDRAAELYGESLRVRTEIGEEFGRAECYVALASLAADRGDLAEARRLLDVAERTRAPLDVDWTPRGRLLIEQLRARAGVSADATASTVPGQ
jgi:non-specific serine/threonine protein kinase